MGLRLVSELKVFTVAQRPHTDITIKATDHILFLARCDSPFMRTLPILIKNMLLILHLF